MASLIPGMTMSKLPKYVTLRGGVYQYCRHIPEDIRSHPDFAGKNTVRQSLKTGDLRVAVQEAIIVGAEVEQSFRKARAELKAGPVLPFMPSPDDLGAIHFIIEALTWVSGRMVWSGRDGHPTYPTPPAGQVFDAYAAGIGFRLTDDHRRSFHSLLGDRLSRPGFDKTFDTMYSQLRHGLQISCTADGSVPPWVQGIPAVFDQLVADAARSTLPMTLAGLPYPMMSAPAAQAPMPVGRIKPAKTVADLISEFSKEKTLSQLGNYKPLFPIMREVLGESTPLEMLDRPDFTRLRDVLVHLPTYAQDPARRPQYEGWKLVDIAADVADRLEAGEAVDLIKPGAINKYLTNIGIMFRWAVDEGLSKTTFANKLRINVGRVDDEEEERRKPFTDAKLKTIFPKDWKPVSDVDWMLLLGLYHGLRGNEAAQLHVTDLREEGGIHYLNITDFTTLPDGSRKKIDKSVKNKPSRRRVPIHPKLIQLGFLDMAEARGKTRATVFDVRCYKNGSYYDSIRDRITGRLDDLKVKSDAHTYHSFRHNFRDALRRAKVDHHVGLALGGWSQGKGAEAGYGTGYPLEMLAEAIQGISYPLDI